MTTIMIGILAFMVGALIVWFWRTRALNVLTARVAPLEAELNMLRPVAAEIESSRFAAMELQKALVAANARNEGSAATELELSYARQSITNLTAQNAGLGAKLDAIEAAHKEQIDQLTKIRQDVQDNFKILAGDILKTSSDDFSKRAEDIFKAQKDQTTAEIDKRSLEMAGLVKPLGDTLKAYEAALKEVEKARIEGFTNINTELQNVSNQSREVRDVTANLVNALRTSPKTRGRWGEETLRRVMELSGMVHHCDFETEKHFPGEDESIRPDVIINVAGGRSIIVDAKTPTSAYLDAISASTDEEREAALQRHAEQFRSCLTNLSSKYYQDKIAGSSDCVVMFVPGENFVSAAFERDPDLFQDGINNRILICTPTIFIGLAKALSYGWRQERLAESALEVAKLARELYSRLATFGDYVADLGRHIKSSAKKYNELVGSLESSVMPQARRFNELGVEGTAKPLPEVRAIDTVVRFPKSDRDLQISSTIQES